MDEVASRVEERLARSVHGVSPSTFNGLIYFICENEYDIIRV